MTPATQQLIDAAFEMMAATKKEYPKEGTPEFFALTDVAHRLECAGIAYKRELVAAKESVPPEARAVEAAEKLHPEFSRSWIEQLESGDNNGASPARMEEYREMFRKAQAERDRIAAIIQRTCFPPSEGEEWAKKVDEVFAHILESLGRYHKGTMYMEDVACAVRLAVAELKAIAPARPTAAREDTAFLAGMEEAARIANSCTRGSGCYGDAFTAACDIRRAIAARSANNRKENSQ